MAQLRVKDQTLITGPVLPADCFLASRPVPDEDRRVTFAGLLASMGFANFTVGTLPVGIAGGLIYVTDGRKVGEGAAAGTGVVCSWNLTNWITVDAGTPVAA